MLQNFFEKNLNIKVFFILAAVIFSLYGKTVFYNFVHFDDDVLILDKQNYLKAANIKNIITDPVFARENDKYYRPVLNLSFLCDKIVYNVKPYGYHLTNVLIHLSAVFSIFIMFSLLKYDKTLSFLFSLLFAVHPALVKSVAWIPGRNDSLLALFCVLSFYFFVKYCNNNGRYNLFFHILFFILSLFTKETAVVSVFVYIFYIIAEKYKIKQYLNIVYIWLGLITVFFVIRHFIFSYQPADTPINILFNSALTNIPVLIRYAQLIIFPTDISILASKIDINYFHFSYTVILFILLFFTAKNKIRLRFVIFYSLWFLLYIIPSCLVPNNNYDVHRIYLPMAGIFLLLAEISEDFYKKNTKMISIFLIVISSIFFSISFYQTDKFKNKQIFWVNALIDNPESDVANANVAGLLADSYRYKDAEKKYLKAISLAPKESKHYVNLAVLYIHMNNIKAAKTYLLKALNLNSYNEMIYYNLAQIYKHEEKKEAAIAMRNKYLEIFKTQNRYDKPLEIKTE